MIVQRQPKLRNCIVLFLIIYTLILTLIPEICLKKLGLTHFPLCIVTLCMLGKREINRCSFESEISFLFVDWNSWGNLVFGMADTSGPQVKPSCCNNNTE